MTSYLYYQYFYKYRDQRKYIKNLVESDNILSASTRLNDVILEDDNYIIQKNVTTEFAILDNMSLHHARDHLNEFQNNVEQIEQKDATISALNE